MASSTIYHSRSISLPSRPHPVSQQLDLHLSRLRSSQSASSSSSPSQGLNSLQDVYSCIDELIQLPLKQTTHNTKWVDQMLDGSVKLLDICSATRDALQQSKDRLQDVQSALRRRCSGELSIVDEANAYIKTRRSVKKSIKKILKNLKTESEKIGEDDSTVNVIKDVQAITAETFKSLLSYIGGSQKNGWSIVGKLINKNTNKEMITKSAFDEVDASLHAMICNKKKNTIMDLNAQILELETDIQDLDESLECLFRHLVKTRATLLNICSY